VNEIRGTIDARQRRFGIAAAGFNELVVAKLVEGAAACFRAHGVAEDDLVLVWVPGAFELPQAARRLAQDASVDAVVCLGAVIRGETAHFDFVAAEAARGIAQAAVDTGLPVLFGVLTTDNMGQALDRAGGKQGNKGWDAAMAAMQMASVLDQLAEGAMQGNAAPHGDREEAGTVSITDATRRRSGASRAKE
jgi:6,7-dimethyl-8-ribityllumazine synthase